MGRFLMDWEGLFREINTMLPRELYQLPGTIYTPERAAACKIVFLAGFLRVPHATAMHNRSTRSLYPS